MISRLMTTVLFASLATPSIVAQSEIRQLEPIPEDGGYAWSIANAGDVDGDGIPDTIVGAFLSTITAPPFTLTGAAIVYSGSDGSEIYRRYGTAYNQFFGRAVSGAGDVNGDGFDDFVVGQSTSVFPQGPGMAFVFSGADGLVLHNPTGLADGDFFGHSCAAAGDVNGDGFDDVIIGADQVDPSHPLFAWFGPGYAKVISGRDGSVLHTFTGTSTGYRFGAFVGGLGDVDGDGFDDVFVGAAGQPAFGNGYVRVFSGADGTMIREHAGGQLFGGHVASAGDCDGDGTTDYLVSDSGSAVFPALVHLYSGATGAELHTFSGPSPEFGSTVSSAGDVNGDGFDEVAITEFSTSVTVFTLHPAPAAIHTFPAPAPGQDSFGQTLSPAGDVDDDGFGDLLVGAPQAQHPTGLGRVYVYDLGATGTPPRARTHGRACLGGAGLLRIDQDGHARVGTTMQAKLRGASPTTMAQLLVGESVDVPLDPIGMTGCSLFVAPFASASTLTDAHGRAAIDLTWPNNPSVIGVPVDLQWASLELTAPHAIPVATSNALATIVGS